MHKKSKRTTQWGPITYKVTNSAEAYLKVDNVADRLAGPVGGAGDNTVGRVFHFGIRVND